MVKNQEIQVGEIIVGSWGYEARYPEFYRVLKLQNGWITLQKLQKVQVGMDGDPYGGGCRLMNTNGQPNNEKAFRRKIGMNSQSQNQYVKINSYEFARKWDGENEEEYNYH